MYVIEIIFFHCEIIYIYVCIRERVWWKSAFRPFDPFRLIQRGRILCITVYSRRETREAGLKDYGGEGTRYAKPKSGINLRTMADARSADRPQQQLTTVPFLVAHAWSARRSFLARSIHSPPPPPVFYSFPPYLDAASLNASSTHR